MTGDERVSHLVVFGVGGVGGYFGGKIAAATARDNEGGWRTHFVARGEHLERLRDAGLTLEASGEHILCKPASAVASLSEAPVPDAVLLCVKGYDLEDAARQIAAHCHKDTIVVPLLNGVDICERVRAFLPTGYVLPSCALVGTRILRPGLVKQEGGDGLMFLGPDPAHPGFVPTPLLQLLERSRVSHRWFEDSRPAIWEKFVFISAFGLVTATSSKTIGEVLLDDQLMQQVAGIMGEVVAIAECEGVDLPGDAVGTAMTKARAFPFETKTSLQRDVEAGRAHEGEIFGGSILRLGERHGIRTPWTRQVYSLLGA